MVSVCHILSFTRITENVITQTPPCLTVGVMFLVKFYTDVTGLKPFIKVQLLSCLSTECIIFCHGLWNALDSILLLLNVHRCFYNWMSNIILRQRLEKCWNSRFGIANKLVQDLFFLQQILSVTRQDFLCREVLFSLLFSVNTQVLK